MVVMVRMVGMRHESGLAHRREWQVGTGQANRTNFVDGLGKMRIFVQLGQTGRMWMAMHAT